MNLKSTTVLSRSLCLSALVLAASATIGQPQSAAAVDLKFNNQVQPNNLTTGFGGLTLGPGYSGNVINYRNVAPGVDARVTATVFGANYSFAGHLPNYSTATGEPAGDSGSVYQIAANKTGLGGMTYKFDLFQSGGTFTNPYTATALRILAYDVDGEASQGEAMRVFKGVGNTGLSGYQVGNTAQALIPTEDATSYLFSGRDSNVPETDASGATILYFENTNSFTLQFEANTRTASTGANPVFTAVDGDLSILGANEVAKQANITTNYSTRVNAKKLPEPFTIIGTIVGGTAAFRLRKKLKAANKA